MVHRIAFVAAIALAAAAGMSAHAQSALPCDSFVRNPDGSWTVSSNVAFPGPGQNINLRQGAVMRPGFVILGTDVAAELNKGCASVPVQQPQADLTTLANPQGEIDMQALTCGQLAGTYQEDADFLLAWYSGWSNGQAKRSALNVKTVKDAIHSVIVYCKANTGKRVSEAIAAVTARPR